MFPLGDLMKWEVKHMAMENNLEKIALKHESMGICFIGSRNFQHFIEDVCFSPVSIKNIECLFLVHPR